MISKGEYLMKNGKVCMALIGASGMACAHMESIMKDEKLSSLRSVILTKRK